MQAVGKKNKNEIWKYSVLLSLPGDGLPRVFVSFDVYVVFAVPAMITEFIETVGDQHLLCLGYLYLIIYPLALCMSGAFSDVQYVTSWRLDTGHSIIQTSVCNCKTLLLSSSYMLKAVLRSCFNKWKRVTLFLWGAEVVLLYHYSINSAQ